MDDQPILATRFNESRRSECEQYPSWDYSGDCIRVDWLNLLFLLPLSRALQGRSEAIWRYPVRKDIRGRKEALRLLKTFEEKLKEIFPHSFLFRLDPSQLEYRSDQPRPISLETLEILYHQTLDFDFSGQIEGEKCLSKLIREAWQRTQTPIPHTKLALAGDDYAMPREDQKGLTWLWEDFLLPPQERLANRGDLSIKLQEF